MSLVTDDPRRSANDGAGVCGWILVILSYILVAITVPFSLCLCIKVGPSTDDLPLILVISPWLLGCSRV